MKQNLTRFAVFILLTLMPQVLWGALSLPVNLSDGDQLLILQYLGFGTSFRPLTSPSPLGLYSGVELGVSLENTPTGDIGYLGNGASVERSIFYPRISLGKGIFDRVDLLFSFSPYSQGTGLGIYSGGLRWVFFQATFVPASFAVLFSATATNLNNLFLSQTEGVDLITGVNADNFSIYIGAGTYYGQGQFDPSITAENAATNVIARSFHTLAGATGNYSIFFVAAELDNYATTNYSFKLGSRF